jgi:uncharacterized membrane protein (UPF0127 family)
MAATRTTITKAAGAAVVCDSCLVADSFGLRLRGLLGRPELAGGEGLLLRPSGSIHTWFMRFAIDAVFLDRHFRVVHTAAAIRPWRMARARRARAVLELAAGEAARRGIAVGDQLMLGEAAV